MEDCIFVWYFLNNDTPTRQSLEDIVGWILKLSTLLLGNRTFFHHKVDYLILLDIIAH